MGFSSRRIRRPSPTPASVNLEPIYFLHFSYTRTVLPLSRSAFFLLYSEHSTHLRQVFVPNNTAQVEFWDTPWDEADGEVPHRVRLPVGFIAGTDQFWVAHSLPEEVERTVGNGFMLPARVSG